MTDGFLGDLVAHGLFAWSFMDQSTFNDASTAVETANYQLVEDAVERYSRHRRFTANNARRSRGAHSDPAPLTVTARCGLRRTVPCTAT